jgi:uncharacterized protein (DUF2236 family)
MNDPLGRLAGTIQWLTITTFAARESIMREAGRVRGMHGKVRGSYTDSRGHNREYDASDPHLLMWVHIAFMESFLRCHQTYSSTPVPGGADEYIRLWGRSVEPLGLSGAPRNEAEMLTTIDAFQEELTVSDQTREVLQWLRKPPLPIVAGIAYRLLYQAAYLTLPTSYQSMIGMPVWPKSLVIPVTRCFLGILRWIIGPENPIQDAALERLKRAASTRA